MNVYLSPLAPENLVSREGFGNPVPRQPAHLYTQAEPGKNVNNRSVRVVSTWHESEWLWLSWRGVDLVGMERDFITDLTVSCTDIDLMALKTSWEKL